MGYPLSRSRAAEHIGRRRSLRRPLGLAQQRDAFAIEFRADIAVVERH